MPGVSLVLDPSKLTNPDLDLRYLLPKLLAERTGGAVEDDGYDYDDEGRLVIYVTVDDVDRWLPSITAVLEGETLLGNDLHSVVVRVEP